jgi:hypothetical protein
MDKLRVLRYGMLFVILVSVGLALIAYYDHKYSRPLVLELFGKQARASEALNEIPAEVTLALIDIATQGGKHVDDTYNLFGATERDYYVSFTSPAAAIFSFTERLSKMPNKPAVDDTSSYAWSKFLYENKVIETPDAFITFHQRYLEYRTNYPQK